LLESFSQLVPRGQSGTTVTETPSIVSWIVTVETDLAIKFSCIIIAVLVLGAGLFVAFPTTKNRFLNAFGRKISIASITSTRETKRGTYHPTDVHPMDLSQELLLRVHQEQASDQVRDQYQTLDVVWMELEVLGKGEVHAA